jgi:hypothetical protein
VGFLFRKYAQQPPDDDVSQDPSLSVESEEEPAFPPPELRWFPPSHKAQLILIAAGFVILNVVLMAVLAIALYLNLR